MWEIVLLVAWLWCGYLALGFEFAVYLKMHQDAGIPMDDFDDTDLWLLIFLLGPLSLSVVFSEGSTKLKRRYPWQSTRWKP